MQAIQVINGATAPSEAKNYTISPEGKALANIPGWKLLADPNYAKVADRTVLNRAIYNSNLASFDTAGTASTVPLSTFTNSEKAFAPTDSSPMRLNPNIEFPEDHWSVVFVAKPSVKETGDAINNIICANNTGSYGDLSPKISFLKSTNSLKIYSNGGPNDETTGSRLSYTSTTPLSEETAVYIVTGSSKNGLAIYKNGAKVASSETAAAKTPLNRQTGAGEWHVLRGARGLFGYVGVLGIDLNDATNEAYREKINSFLKQKYAIV